MPEDQGQDGYNRPVLLNPLEPNAYGNTSEKDTDGICLDGKRLFRRPAGSCDYANPSTPCYEPEARDFSTITGTSDYSRFTVVTKSGETRYYGLLPADRILATDRTKLSQKRIQGIRNPSSGCSIA